MSFLVFTFGSLLVAIQVAGGQYTPRIIATTLLRDNAIRFSVGYFVFTLLFAIRVLIRMDGVTVHQFNVFLAATLGATSIVVFLYLIDYAARMLRPISIVRRVGEDGIAVIESLYPKPTASAPCRQAAPARARTPGSHCHSRRHLGDRARRRSGGTRRAGTARQRDDRIRPAGGRLRRGRMTLCSGYMAAPVPSTTVRCAGRSRSGPSAPSNRTRHLPFVSWSISRSRRCRRRSTIRRRRSPPSTSFIVCCAWSVCGN